MGEDVCPCVGFRWDGVKIPDGYPQVEEGAALRNELHQRQGDVLELRSLIARLPLTEYAPSPTLQAWYDEMKAVMGRTNPRWLDTR